MKAWTTARSRAVSFNREDVEPITTIYYEGMGWDGEYGIPTEGTLYQLGVGWAN